MIALNHGLEQITKTSINDLSEGLVEIFHSILAELISVSRSARNMNTISNVRLAAEGQHKQFAALNYDLDTREMEW